jgi:hypothetical protein
MREEDKDKEMDYQEMLEMNKPYTSLVWNWTSISIYQYFNMAHTFLLRKIMQTFLLSKITHTFFLNEIQNASRRVLEVASLNFNGMCSF